MLRKSALSKSIASAVPLAVTAWATLPAFAQQNTSWQMGAPIVTGWLLGYSDGGSLTDSIASYDVAGGYNLAWVASTADLVVAQEHGLRAMYLDPTDIEPSMVGTSQLNSLITQLDAQPAFYSYFLADEPTDSDFSGLGSLVSYLNTQDPTHLSYINLLPLGSSVSQYQTYLNEYMATVKPSMLSYDNYEFIAPTTSTYLENLAMISQSAQSAGIPFLNTVPGTAVGSAPTPNTNQFRFLLYSTLAYGGTGISYWFGGEGVNPTTTVYNELTPLNHEFVNVGQQLEGLHPIGTYLKGYQTTPSQRPPGTVTLPTNSPFQVNITDTVRYNTGDALQGVLLGLFGASGASVANATYVLAQNIDNALSRTFMLTGPGNLSIYDATDGYWTPTGSAQTTLTLLPGGGTLVGLTSTIPGYNSIWTAQSGDWNSTVNWSGGIPNSINAVATFGSSITATHTVFTDIATTMGTINFDNPSASYVISGAGSLTMETSSGSAGINVQSGSHKINLPLTFASNTVLNIASGATLTIGNPTTIAANQTVTQSGGNLLIQAPLTIQSGGALVLGAQGASLSSAPALATGAKIDVQNGSMTVDYQGQSSPAATIQSQLASGFNHGTWDGSGIDTSASTANTGLGWMDSASSESIEVKYTYYGDANLDGTVDSSDFADLAANYGKTGSGAGWVEGDFNYDGTVNALDFNALATNYGDVLSSTQPALGTVVPEPAIGSMLLLGSTALLRRKRRNAGA